MEAPKRAFAVCELWGPPEDVELALAFLVENGSTGSEKDPANGRHQVYSPASIPMINLMGELDTVSSAVSYRSLPELPDRDWLSEWNRGFTGLVLGETFFVHPTQQSCLTSSEGTSGSISSRRSVPGSATRPVFRSS
jgi:hypothetical protein